MTTGPPVTLDWRYESEQTYNLNDYESVRSSNRRRQAQMKMPPQVRTQILQEHGYSNKNIRKVTKEASMIRRQLRRSLETLHKDPMDEKVETIKRALSKPFRGKKQREEEKLLKEYYNSWKDFNEQSHYFHSFGEEEIDETEEQDDQERAQPLPRKQEPPGTTHQAEEVDPDATRRTMNVTLTAKTS